MLNKIFILLLIVSVTANAQQPKHQNFSMVGDVSKVPGATHFYISYTNAEGRKITDSANITNGKFKLSGYISEPQLAAIQLFTDSKTGLKPVVGKKNFTSMFLEAANYKVKINDWLSEATITGSTLHDQYQKYRREIQKLYLEMRPHNERKRMLENQNDTVELKKELKVLDSLRNVEEKFVANYVGLHKNSPVALAVLGDFSRSNIDIKPRPFERYFNLLNPVLQESEMGKKLSDKLQLQRFMAPGSIAPGFSQPDTAGKNVQLKDFRNHYVLVDFWASWCGPCRAEIPFLKKAYEKYKGKNFRIVSISLDTSKERWLEAIQEDGINIWPQLGDMSGKANAVAMTYKISEIPQNVLIDPDGKVIAKNLYKLELEKILEKFLK